MSKSVPVVRFARVGGGTGGSPDALWWKSRCMEIIHDNPDEGEQHDCEWRGTARSYAALAVVEQQHAEIHGGRRAGLTGLVE